MKQLRNTKLSMVPKESVAKAILRSTKFQIVHKLVLFVTSTKMCNTWIQVWLSSMGVDLEV